MSSIIDWTNYGFQLLRKLIARKALFINAFLNIGVINMLFCAFIKMVEAAMKQGYKMNGTPEEIGVFISAAFSGIEKLCILQANYGSDSYGAKIEPKVLFRTLARSVILLFGGKIDEKK